MEMNNNPSLYISTKELSLLLDLTRRQVINKCKKGEFETRTKKVQGGPTYEVYLPSLPIDVQKHWVQTNMLLALTLDDESKKLLEPAAVIEIVKRTTNHLSIGHNALADKDHVEKFSKKLQILRDYKNKPLGHRKSDWVNQPASQYQTSRATVYRYIQLEQNGDQDALVKKRKPKDHTAWDQAAIEYMKACYLATLKELGEINKAAVYDDVKKKAQIMGWKIGSLGSAYNILKKLNHLNEMFARGGRRALDNFFYIKRQYTDLNPFEIIVGDQHKFDYWVKDDEGKVFRPEMYARIDLNTRVVYGFAIDKKYSSYLIGQSMKLGLHRFGLFRKSYTDNGKPETCKYITRVIEDLTRLGMTNHDISELYRDKD